LDSKEKFREIYYEPQIEIDLRKSIVNYSNSYNRSFQDKIDKLLKNAEAKELAEQAKQQELDERAKSKAQRKLAEKAKQKESEEREKLLEQKRKQE
jgi:hypothetical protein